MLAEGQAIPQTLQAEVPEHHELLRPSIVVIDPTTKKPRLLVQTYPRSQELTSYVVNSPWKASPDTRMTELLHATGVRLGLVTNGEHWMLVDAPKGDTTGYASWYAEEGEREPQAGQHEVLPPGLDRARLAAERDEQRRRRGRGLQQDPGEAEVVGERHRDEDGPEGQHHRPVQAA